MTTVIAMMPLTLLRVGFALLLMGVVFGFDVVEEVFAGCLSVGCELIQENLELLYHKKFGLDQYHAQMATAYTLFVIVVVISYFAFIKFAVVFKEVKSRWQAWREKIDFFYTKYQEIYREWWKSTDTLNRCFAVIAMVVVAIPLVSVVCIALGKFVAELV